MKTPTKPSRVGRPRKSEAAFSRDVEAEILIEAAKLFAQTGYDNASTIEIAARAGVAQSVVHYYFKSKEKLWQSTILALIKRIDTEFPLDTDRLKMLKPEEALVTIIRNQIQICAKYPEFAKLAIVEGSMASERLDWLVETYFRKHYRLLDTYLNKARAAGKLPNVPNHLLSNVIYSASSVLFAVAPMVLTVYGVDIKNPHQKEQIVLDGIEILLYGILGRKNAV